MRGMFLRSPSPASTRSTTPPTSPRHTISASFMEESIEIARAHIARWDSESSTRARGTSIFHEKGRDGRDYLNAVEGLQSAMQFLAVADPSSEKLVHAHRLMKVAVNRLEKEFYQILSSTKQNLDAESVSSRSSRSSLSDFDDVDSTCSEQEFHQALGESIFEKEQARMMTMSNLKSIADCMIHIGYGKECVKIYKLVRKSIVMESLYNLGVLEPLNHSQVQKMDWEVLEKKIKIWLRAVRIAVTTLFKNERMLCDHVFSSSDAMRDSCFTEISKDGAITLFGFPELVAKYKKTPEKIFRTLDLYETISDLWPEIECIFSLESAFAIRSKNITSLVKLGESIRSMLLDFESAIEKDSSKTAVRGGAVHPLTRYVMNYISLLSDYTDVISDIVADWPLPLQSKLSASFIGSPCSDEEDMSPSTLRFAWLVLVLLCKLDGKAELYNDVAQSYLFLANNLQYIVSKVRSSNLRHVLGDLWLATHESKVKQFALNYERAGWDKVLSSLPRNQKAKISPEDARQCFVKFNRTFEEAYAKHSSWLVPDPNLRDLIKLSVKRMLIAAYREFYDSYRFEGLDPVIKFTPGDLGNYLSDILGGDGGSSCSLSPSISPHVHRR